LVDWGLDGIAAAANFTENIFIMKAITFSILMALVALSFVRPAHPTSFIGYISFKGSKQGQLKGKTSGKGGREDKGFFQIQSFDMAGEVPTDASKPGAAQGKRTHKPFTITKEVDASSPLLLQAHYTNETLETVIIELAGRPASGVGEVVTERITLTNATIARYTTDKGTESLALNYEQMTSQK
jgi:type VI secretion system secreted protein Hcp